MKMLLVLFSVFSLGFCTFTPHFKLYLRDKYGLSFEEEMTRSDMGSGLMGSFGGKQSNNDKIKNQPVIFVHGVTLRAGVFLSHIQFFHQNGYTMAELYSTTYGDGGITPMFLKDMACADVKHIRQFILAVAEYTNSTVDIISYSMGTAITRKAVLGGHCVDTGEYIGEPLTSIVDTFVAVGGVAYGLENCPTAMKACNGNNGMICGSDYLNDVNSQSERFEAANTFAIYSTDDHIVGQNCCGHQCSNLKNATAISKHAYLNHGTVLTMTKKIQLSMIRDHHV